MVTQRERLRERGLSQISVWLPDDVVGQIKTMAERLGLSLPKFIERSALAYQPESTNPPDYVGELTFDLMALTDRVAALEKAGKAKVAVPAVSPVLAAAGVVVSLPAPPSGGDRGAKAALRDPVILELHKKGLLHREIQAELTQRGIFANGKNGQPTAISLGVISTVIKRAGLE